MANHVLMFAPTQEGSVLGGDGVTYRVRDGLVRVPPGLVASFVLLGYAVADTPEVDTLAEVDATSSPYLSGITAGTAAAGKAVVLNASKGVATLTSATITTLTATTVGATTGNLTTLNAGASGTAGTVNVFPATASRGKLAVTCTDQTGNTTVGLNVAAMGQATVVTLPDPGAATASVMTSTASLTALTASAVEHNSLTGQPGGVTISTSTPASGSCAVQLFVKQTDGATSMTRAASGLGYVSTVDGLDVVATTGIATLTNGCITELVTGKVFHWVCEAAGALGFTLTAGAASYYVTLVLPNGKLATTGAIVVNA